MTTTWHEAKARLAPRYSVSNERYETAYSIPLGSNEDRRRIDLRFSLAPNGPENTTADYRDLDVDFSLQLTGSDGEPVATLALEKRDIVTLQKLLTSVLEHSRVRRFEWLAERQARVPSRA